MSTASTDSIVARPLLATSATGQNASSSLLACNTTGTITTTSWLLPVYGPLPTVWRAALEIADTLATSAPDSGFSRMDFVTSTQPSGAMESGGIIVLPLRAPLDIETADYSFLGAAGVALFVLRGAPSAWTGVRLVGCHGGSMPPDVATGDYFRFLTPTNFIVAKEEMLALGQQWAATLLGKRNRSTLEDEGIDMDLDKRRRGMQVELGVQTATDADPPQGERGSTYLVDLEGRQHLTRVRTDLSSRETSLAVIFRATEKGRWRHAMGAECILQVNEYREMVKEQYKTQHEDREVAFESCGLLDRVFSLGFTWDNGLLEKLVTGKVGTTQGFLRLQNFLEEGANLPTEDVPDRGHNRLMVVAMANLELVLVIFLAPAFTGCTAVLRECLEGIKRPLELAPAGYLLHEVELVIAKFFRVLRTGSQAGEDLSNPTGCARYLASLFGRFITQTASPGLLNESVNRYRLVMSRDSASRQKEGQGQRPRSKATFEESTLRTPPPQVKLEPPPLVRREMATGVCVGHFGGQLRLVDPKMGKVYSCSRGPGVCKFQHKDSKNMSRAAIVEVANTFSPSLRDGFLAALAAQKQ